MELRFLSFIGPKKETASVSFGSGLNIIYGPSNTGKSSIVDAIDYMFGRERKLSEKPEHEGYDQILLGISFSKDNNFTLIRNIQGGDIQCISGLHHSIPSDSKKELLKLKNQTKKNRTISQFLFKELEIFDKKLKKNAKNELTSLTIRNSIPLALVTESEIQKEGSPYFHQGPFKATEESSRLKFFLTGVDDGSLLPSEKEKLQVSRSAKIDLLNELIEEITIEIKDILNKNQTHDELIQQKSKLDKNIERKLSNLTDIEKEIETKISESKRLSYQLNENEERLSEVESMISRFNLLNKQYSSDISRLENISEVGTLFIALPDDNCPLCGSQSTDNVEHNSCDGDIDNLVESATAEKQKLLSLKKELVSTLDNLKTESQTIIINNKKISQEIKEIKSDYDKLSNILLEHRESYKEVIELKEFINKSLRLFEQKNSLEEKIYNLEKSSEIKKPKTSKSGEEHIPTHALFKLSSAIKSILSDWKFLSPESVYFDKEEKDFVFDGKHRGSNGKGFRALTHAACSLGLMKFQEENSSLPHFGFVLLDSPLLAYEKPDNLDDDLSETDININFFKHLSKWKSRQVIIIENKKSIPVDFSEGDQITKFTGTNAGRYGFFPMS